MEENYNEINQNSVNVGYDEEIITSEQNENVAPLMMDENQNQKPNNWEITDGPFEEVTPDYQIPVLNNELPVDTNQQHPVEVYSEPVVDANVEVVEEIQPSQLFLSIPVLEESAETTGYRVLFNSVKKVKQ